MDKIKNRSLAVYGDSISCGIFTGPNDTAPDSTVDKPWHKIVCEELGFENRNYSVSGISASRTSAVMSGSALSLCYDRIEGEPGIIIIAVGTNDFGTGVPVGCPDDISDVSFYGALNVICAGITEKHPESRIFWLLSLGRKGAERNGTGASLDDYRGAIRAVSERYGIKAIDCSLYGFRSDDPTVIAETMRDGVHIDRRGHSLLAAAVIAFLKEQKTV